jgi:proteasome lid subunit RPN8/RPN11
MVDFQPQSDIIDKCIVWLMNQTQEEEPVAAILVRKGKAQLVPLKNHSDDPVNYFVLGEDFAQLQLKGEITYVIHGHHNNSVPSEYDIASCNSCNIPYIIFNRNDYSYNVVKPSNYRLLSGVSYEFGVNDCFESARNWYLMHGVPIPKRGDWIDDWWLEGHDYIKDLDKVWPFTPSNGLEYGTLVTFAVESDIENHLGIYLDNDIFFHHAVHRLSCKENLYPFWGKFIRNTYKYERGNIKRIPW